MGALDFAVYTTFGAKDKVSPVLGSITKKANACNRVFNLLNKTNDKFGSCIQAVTTKANFFMNAFAGSVIYQTAKDSLNSCVNMASDLQETMGKTEQTFKNSASSVLEWSKTSISSMGLAKQTALDTASLFGDMGTGMGMATDRAADMSMSLVQLSADLASYKNMSQDMTKNALKGIFTGETEALKNLGVVMTQDILEGYAKTLGMRKKFKDMTQAEKIELRYSYVMSSTKNAQGDFTRTGGNYANQQRVLEEQQKELQTRWGNILLPRYTSILVSMNKTLAAKTPSLEKGFEKIFVAFEAGLKACNPIFQKFNELFLYLKTNLLPEVAKYTPLLKSLFLNVIVPGITLALDGLKGLFIVIDKTYNAIKGTFNFVKDNFLPLLLTLPIAIVGVQKAIFLSQMAMDVFRLKMYLLKMEGGLLSVVMNTKLISAISGFTSTVWKSVTALLAQAAAFFASPIGLITLGVMALVGVTILLWKNWDKVTATVSNWWQNTKTALSGFWDNCTKVFASIGDFIKNNFINILLGALGPIGWIIQGVYKIGGAIGALNKGEDIELNVGSGTNGTSIENTTFIKNDKQYGKIDVGVTVDNRTNFNASSSLSLESPNNLKLQPST